MTTTDTGMTPAFGAAHAPNRQKGAILVVSLIILMIVTILALAGVQGVALQGRASANAYDDNISFQAAETALRWAELELMNHQDTVGTIEQFDAETAPAPSEFAEKNYNESIWQKEIPDAMKPAGVFAKPKVTVQQYDENCFLVYSIGIGRSRATQTVLNSVVCRE
ncbi:hypothetical protein AGMMS50289_10370 [Betaproteobacteria bacterium]|nr:hypothetical protein AGMMS50289_10370 [Betaproteobacteria bacterium]